MIGNFYEANNKLLEWKCWYFVEFEMGKMVYGHKKRIPWDQKAFFTWNVTKQLFQNEFLSSSRWKLLKYLRNSTTGFAEISVNRFRAVFTRFSELIENVSCMRWGNLLDTYLKFWSCLKHMTKMDSSSRYIYSKSSIKSSKLFLGA